MAKDNEALKQARTLSNSSVIGLSVIVFLAVAAMVVAGVLDEKAKRDYKNVVIENKNGRLLVEDIVTKEQRIVNLNRLANRKDAQYIQKGDTLNVRTHDKTYKETKVFDTHNGKFTFNEDSVYVRQQRELFYSEIQKMQKVRER